MSKLTHKFSMVLGATVKVTLALFLVIFGASVALAQNKAYVALLGSNAVAVIDTTTNTVITTIPVGSQPISVDVTPNGAFVYVANQLSASISVIATATNTVVTTIPGITAPLTLTITPNGASVYVSTVFNGVQVIATASNTVVAAVPVVSPARSAVTPDGDF